MKIEDFGAALLDAGDLDPVYDAAHRASLAKDQLRRWLLAYWCCYDIGESCWLSEAEDFWGSMRLFAANTTESPVGGRWPRARERRHFRGDKAVFAVSKLAMAFPDPRSAVASLEQPGPFQVIRDRILRWPMFGPWIAFKAGDMLERIAEVKLDFSSGDVFVFDSPLKAAELWSGETGAAAVVAACDHLTRSLGQRLAPPSNDRPLNLQEFETILCKWGSSVKGHYRIGEDVESTRKSLQTWAPVSPTAGRMLS